MHLLRPPGVLKEVFEAPHADRFSNTVRRLSPADYSIVARVTAIRGANSIVLLVAPSVIRSRPITKPGSNYGDQDPCRTRARSPEASSWRDSHEFVFAFRKDSRRRSSGGEIRSRTAPFATRSPTNERRTRLNSPRDAGTSRSSRHFRLSYSLSM